MSDNVLYKRGEDVESDAWDDTILIKAYDNAVSAMKAKLCEQHPDIAATQNINHRKKRSRQKKKGSKSKKSANLKCQKDWSIGDFCKAIYTEDGEIYAAQIIDIHATNGTCTVQYTEYGNEEEQVLDDLLSISSDLSSTDNKTETASEPESLERKAKERHSSNTRSHKQSNSSGQRPRLNPPRWPWTSFPCGPPPPPPPPVPPQMFPHIPPPPPPPMFDNYNSEEDNEALYTMLISWYMSGYHTGYYQGLKSSAKSSAGASTYIPHR